MGNAKRCMQPFRLNILIYFNVPFCRMTLVTGGMEKARKYCR